MPTVKYIVAISLRELSDLKWFNPDGRLKWQDEWLNASIVYVVRVCQNSLLASRSQLLADIMIGFHVCELFFLMF